MSVPRGDYGEYLSYLKKNPTDFVSWERYLTFLETSGSESSIREGFDLFLSVFPHTFGYWIKYSRLDVKNSLSILERGTKRSPYCPELWDAYLEAALSTTDVSLVRGAFEGAVSTVGNLYYSRDLWSRYSRWELKVGNAGASVRVLYRSLLAPRQGLRQLFQEFRVQAQNLRYHQVLQLLGDLLPAQRPVQIISFEQDQNMVSELIDSVHERVQRMLVLAMRMENYEAFLRSRTFFHVTEISSGLYGNWLRYFDYLIYDEEAREIPFETKVAVFEMGLIVGGIYPEFYHKYYEFLQGAGNSDGAREILLRGLNTNLRLCPELHFYLSQHYEALGDVETARSILQNLTRSVSVGHLESIIEHASFEMRNGSQESVRAAFVDGIAAIKRHRSAESSLPLVALYHEYIDWVPDRKEALQILKTQMEPLALAGQGETEENKRLKVLIYVDLLVKFQLDEKIAEIFLTGDFDNGTLAEMYCTLFSSDGRIPPGIIKNTKEPVEGHILIEDRF